MPIVVLISGRGSNLQAIIDSVQDGLPVDIRAVISNRADAEGLQRARQAGIATQVIQRRDHPDRDTFDAALMAAIDACTPRLVVLAGFMLILGRTFVQHYAGRMINIHPSLLPQFRGLHTHQRAIDAGVDRHGASVHFVTDELDGGPVVLQVSVPVHPQDDADTLAARVLAQEHHILPLALRWLAEGRLQLQDNQVLFDGHPRTEPEMLSA